MPKIHEKKKYSNKQQYWKMTRKEKDKDTRLMITWRQKYDNSIISQASEIEAELSSLIYPIEEMGTTATASVVCEGLISQVPEQFAVSHEICAAQPASLVVRLIG